MILRRVFESLRREGLTGLFERSTLYFVRRLSWRSAAWTVKLERSVAAAGVSKQDREAANRNATFRLRHRGKPCFIIGNGPSINSQDLSLLSGQITLVTNAFWRHPVVEQWQPTYYFISDPVLFEESDSVAQFYADFVSRVPATTFFFPHFAREFIARGSPLDLSRTYFVTFAGSLEHGLDGPPDLTAMLPGVRTVTQFALLAAMYMGCSPIYLLGLDHDWLSRRGAHLTFYQDKAVASERSLDDWHYQELMEAVLTMWRGYEAIRKVATRENIRMVNVTRGGFLDVFERAEYESVVEACSSPAGTAAPIPWSQPR